MRSALICLLFSVVAISADLQSDIEDVASHLPLKEVESIGKQYVAAYPNYADGLRFVDQLSYEKIVKDFLQTKEGQTFIEYFNQRGINIESIWLKMTEKLSIVIRKWLEPRREGEPVGPTITGDIMADYRRALVASGFLDVVHKKMESSPEFASLVAAFKDPEFQARFYRSVNSKGLTGYGNKAQVRGFWMFFATVLQAVASVVVLFG